MLLNPSEEMGRRGRHRERRHQAFATNVHSLDVNLLWQKTWKIFMLNMLKMDYFSSKYQIKMLLNKNPLDILQLNLPKIHKCCPKSSETWHWLAAHPARNSTPCFVFGDKPDLDTADSRLAIVASLPDPRNGSFRKRFGARRQT